LYNSLISKNKKRDKGTKEQRDKGTKEQRNKGTKEQRNKGTRSVVKHFFDFPDILS
jgi:hypothetical protein